MKNWVPPVLFSLSLLVSFVVHSSKLEDRLNKILYWRISDELSLDPKTEKNLVKVLEENRLRREKALKKRVSSFSKMQECEASRKKKGHSKKDHLSEHPQHKKDVETALEDYLESGKALLKVDVDEYEQVVSILGKDKTLRFFVIRKNMADELKNALKK
jgi:hypothetical protein